MKTYLIHDNGGRPFRVTINKAEVKVYQEQPPAPQPLLTLLAQRVYVARGETNSTPNGALKAWKGGEGNTILVCNAPNTYVWIGPEVFQFTTDEPVAEFRSPLGNSNVPYAFAHTEHFTYLLSERAWIPRVTVADPYSFYYFGRGKGTGKPMSVNMRIPRSTES